MKKEWDVIDDEDDKDDEDDEEEEGEDNVKIIEATNIIESREK